MSAAQIVFLSAFSSVNLLIVAIVVLVVREAQRVDGGQYSDVALVRRLSRLPSERVEANRLAFYFQRVSGLAILAFLCLHVFDVSLVAISYDLYDDVHELYGSPVMRLFECGLLAALVFHALNGLRLVAIDIWDLGARAATRVLAAVLFLTVTLTIAGSVIILKPIFAS